MFDVIVDTRQVIDLFRRPLFDDVVDIIRSDPPDEAALMVDDRQYRDVILFKDGRNLIDIVRRLDRTERLGGQLGAESYPRARRSPPAGVRR